MKAFDYYDLRGVLTPGVIIFIGLALLYPQVQALLDLKAFGLGDLGLFVILAYVAGQLLQAAANILADVYWWCWGGQPTDWFRTQKHPLLDAGQTQAAATAIQSRFSRTSPLALGEDTKLDKTAWYGIVRQVYAVVTQSGKGGRVDIFNAQFGLNRGVAAALLIVASLTVVHDPAHLLDNLPIIALLLIGATLACIRMHRFGVHYATELFVQFLQVQAATNPQPDETVTAASAEPA